MPRGAAEAGRKLGVVSLPAWMPVQKFVHLASPLARDDRADGIKEFAPRRHQIRAQIDEPRLIGGMTVEPRGGQAPAQFGAAAPRAAARTGRIDEDAGRSEEHTFELQSLMRISSAVFCLKKKKQSNR